MRKGRRGRERERENEREMGGKEGDDKYMK